MASKRGLPTTPAAAPSTPLTPRAKQNLLPVLDNLALVITAQDDDTPGNKIRYTMDFLTRAAARLDVNLTPIAPPRFTESPAPVSSAAGSPAPGFPARSGRALATLPPSSYEPAIRRIETRYNPDSKELTDSPPPEAFAANAARAPAPAAAPAATPAPAPAAPIPQQMALTQQFLTPQVEALRVAFEAALSAAEFPWTRNNRTTFIKLTGAEVESTSKMIFDDVFNTKGSQRALAIVSSYRSSEHRSNPLSATITAERLALDADLPSDVREFYSGYSACSKSTVKLSAAEQMLVLYDKYKLYNLYLRLANQPSQDLQTLLVDAGQVPKQGHGWVTVMLDYLAHQLGLAKVKLSNLLQELQCVHLMVATLGVGVLVLVPRRIVNFLQRMGVQKCQQIFETAREVGLLKAIAPLCNEARRTIVYPMLRGEAIAPLRIELSRHIPSLIEAVSRSGEVDEMDVDLEEPQEFQPIDADDLITHIEEDEFRGLSDVESVLMGGEPEEPEESESEESESEGSESEGSEESEIEQLSKSSANKQPGDPDYQRSESWESEDDLD